MSVEGGLGRFEISGDLLACSGLGFRLIQVEVGHQWFLLLLLLEFWILVHSSVFFYLYFCLMYRRFLLRIGVLILI